MSSESYGIAVRKGDSTLLGQINTALGQLRESDRYDELHVKWFGAPPVGSE